MQTNIEIIAVFDRLIVHVQKQMVVDKSNLFRLIQIKNAKRTISGLDYPIKNGMQAKRIKGIGSGIASRIDEILRTGTLKELEQPVIMSPETQAIAELCEIVGIGEVYASQLLNRGIKTIEELNKAFQAGEVKLTPQMQLGLKYHKDLQIKIPRDEATTIIEQVSGILKERYPQLNITACGSYRREKMEIGDIDLLLTIDNIQTKQDVESSSILSNCVKAVHKGSNLVLHDLTHGNHNKYMGIIQCGDGLARRIDIRLHPLESLAFGILGFTGSREFNMKIRAIANKSRWKLNDYGLFHRDTDESRSSQFDGQTGSYPASTEEEIFKLLEIDYVEPRLR